MRSSILTSLLLFLVASPSFAEKDDYVIYEAQSRSAEELKKTAENIVSGARLSVLNNKIVVWGTKSQRDKVLQLFGELDHKLRNYVVSLRVAAHGSREHQATAVQARVNGKNIQLHKKSGVLKGSGTGTVAVGNEAGAVAVSAERSEAEDTSDGGQQVTVMDGGTGRLYADSGVFPKNVDVKLRSIGKSGAHLEIREADSNAVGEQRIVTEIDVPFGAWRTLGGVSSQASGRQGELLGGAKQSSMSAHDVQVRVVPEAE